MEQVTHAVLPKDGVAHLELDAMEKPTAHPPRGIADAAHLYQGKISPPLSSDLTNLWQRTAMAKFWQGCTFHVPQMIHGILWYIQHSPKPQDRS